MKRKREMEFLFESQAAATILPPPIVADLQKHDFFFVGLGQEGGSAERGWSRIYGIDSLQIIALACNLNFDL